MDPRINPCGRCGKYPSVNFNPTDAVIQCPDCHTAAVHATTEKCVEYWNALSADYQRDREREDKMRGIHNGDMDSLRLAKR